MVEVQWNATGPGNRPAPDDPRSLPCWFVQRGGTRSVVGCVGRISKQRIGKSAAGWQRFFFCANVAAAEGCDRSEGPPCELKNSARFAVDRSLAVLGSGYRERRASGRGFCSRCRRLRSAAQRTWICRRGLSARWRAQVLRRLRRRSQAAPAATGSVQGIRSRVFVAAAEGCDRSEGPLASSRAAPASRSIAASRCSAAATGSAGHKVEGFCSRCRRLRSAA
ncbi:hypothetical protein TRE132_03430 [Pseudomonas chlororaphis subsp. aurantiaca]|nr:hypothetical protein TRE132_03430 [Pseudomonas chlororaphis subsp. aurantiaca]